MKTLSILLGATALAAAVSSPVFAQTEFAPGANVSGELGTIVLENGDQHVTYNGMPLYYFKDDLEVGETNGEGAGGKWTVAKP